MWYLLVLKTVHQFHILFKISLQILTVQQWQYYPDYAESFTLTFLTSVKDNIHATKKLTKPFKTRIDS